jgi:hypothetical protein
MKNTRTTVAGLLTIIGASITFLSVWVATKQFPDANAWGLLGVAYSTGAGLIAAADGKPKVPPQ